MKLKFALLGCVATLLSLGVAEAATLRVLVVETPDVSAYVKSLQDGQALLKSKGSPGQIRAWVARYAGENAGKIIVSVEYPNIEALAKDDMLLRSDAQLRGWQQTLAKMRKIVSDSIYEELKP
jgi:hypothetical protein